MIKRCTILTCLFVAGCLSSNNDVNQTNVSEVIPEHLQDLENLTVYPADLESVYSIRFERDLAFSGYIEEDDLYILSICMNRISVDQLDRVFFYCGRSIHVFEANGNYLTSMGGNGEGPGEFRRMGHAELHIVDDRLFVVDNTQSLMHVYSLETLRHFKSIVISPEVWMGTEELQGYSPTLGDYMEHYYIRADETILLGFRRPFTSEQGISIATGVGNPNPDQKQYIRYFLVDMEWDLLSGEILKQVDVNFYPGTGGRGSLGILPHLPSVRSSLIAVSDSGQIFSAWTEEFLIKVYAPNGNYLRAFYYPFEKSELDSEQILNRSFSWFPVQSQREIRNNVEFPDTWPALNIMLLDDENRLWVSTIIEDEEHYEWWVLDEFGELLARFNWSGQRLFRHSEPNEIKVVKNGYLYTHETNEETSLNQIVRYRIKLEEIE